MFQQFFLAEHQTVLGNVADGLLYAGVRRGERRRLAPHALDRVGLGHRAAARPTQLSGGRAAAGRDRPGDRRRARRWCWPTSRPATWTRPPAPRSWRLLEELNAAGTTIIVITHDHAVAARMRRRIEMLDGHIIADTTPVPGHRPRRRAARRQPAQEGPS